MFERGERSQQLIDEVYALTESLDRGDTLTHEAIAQVLGMGPHEGAWDRIVGQVRRRLEKERGIATWADITIGYRLLTVPEQVQELPQWRARRAFRQIGRGLRSVRALPESGLSLNQRKARATQIHLFEQRRKSMRQDWKEQQALLALRPMTPRRPASP